MHEHPLARFETGAGPERVVGGDERLGDAPRLDEIEARGNHRALVGPHREVLGLGPAADDPVDAVAGDRAPRPRHPTDSTIPANSRPGDVGGDARRRRVEPGELEEVGPVDPGAVDPHQHVVGTGFGAGDLDDGEGAAAVARGDRQRSHGERLSGLRAPGVLGPPAAPTGPAGTGPARAPAGAAPGATVGGVTEPDLLILDDDGEQVALDASEAASLLAFTEVSNGRRSRRARPVAAASSPRWRSSISCDAPPHPRTGELIDLADEAPTLHLYVADLATSCTHRTWRDPGFDEWSDAVAEPEPASAAARSRRRSDRSPGSCRARRVRGAAPRPRGS